MSAVNPLVVKSVSEFQLVAGANTVLSATIAQGGNYTLYLYYRTVADVSLQVDVAWTDGIGAQSDTIDHGSQLAGQSVSVPMNFLDVAAGSTIAVTATADVGAAAYVSASLKAM